MKNLSLGMAMTLLVVGNLVAVLSDAMIKTVANDVAVFQFVFFRQLSAALILLPFCLHLSLASWRDGLKWHVLRAHIWLLGAVFMVFAIGAMPLATANAIFYAAPLMMLPLAMMMFKETLSKHSVFAAIVGFGGVLVIIRPTHIDIAAISALIVALCLAFNNLLVRKLPVKQTVAQTLLLTNITGLPASLGLAVAEGQPWDWSAFPTALASSVFILVYAASCVVAYRSAESNKIASAEYSGLIGAMIVGLWWFGEMPDWLMVVGSAMIIGPLFWLSKKEKRAQQSEAT